MSKINTKVFISGSIIIVLIVIGLSFIDSPTFGVSYEVEAENENFPVEENIEEPVEEKIIPEYVDTPENVKAIYMSACVAATPSFRDELVKLTEETELNSIMIDIKDFSGTIAIETELEGKEAGGCRAPDMREFIQTLHEKGIYVIGRITVFQDPFYSKRYPELAVKKASDGSVWVDHKGLSFIEVGAKPYWEYIVKLSKESYKMGFDELNFDYIRFPSDGNMKDIAFPFSEEIISQHEVNGKSYALEEFFKYLKVEMDELGVVTSADIFGMTTTNTDDLNIGQLLEKTMPYFDYVAPMVYPSHYPNNFNGWSNPNHYPHEVVEYAMTEAVRRVNEMKNSETLSQEVKDFVSPNQLRTWIQDFDYGGNYGAEEVRTQIQASYDAGVDSWMIWAPSNRYTRGALLDAE
jgi:hypothetical protein